MRKTQQKRPTRIIKKPTKVAGCLMITCDNNKTYTMNELGQATGVHPSTLYSRLKKDSWKSPFILASCKWSSVVISKRIQTRAIRKKEKGTLSHLGCRPRPEKLARIPGPTHFDCMCG